MRSKHLQSGLPTLRLVCIALRRDLEHLSNDVGAKLLRALGVTGDEEKLRRASDEFYYQTVSPAITREGDVLTLLDVLARDVGIRGIFTDWAATVTYYANCKGLK